MRPHPDHDLHACPEGNSGAVPAEGGGGHACLRPQGDCEMLRGCPGMASCYLHACQMHIGPENPCDSEELTVLPISAGASNDCIPAACPTWKVVGGACLAAAPHGHAALLLLLQQVQKSKHSKSELAALF